MSIIDSIKGLVTKLPSFPVSNTSQYFAFDHMSASDNYLEQYEGWTYKAIKIKADAVQSYKQRLMRVNGDNYDEITNDNILSDLYRFNDFQSYGEARILTWIHVGLTGGAYWLMTESEAKKHRVDFYLLDPEKITIKTNALGLPEYYEYQDINGMYNKIEPQNLIIFKEPDPENWLKPYGALQASRYAHNATELALKYNQNVFGNSGRPEGMLMIEGISEEDQRRIESKLKQKYGGVQNARKIGVSNRILQWLEMSKTPKDLDFVKGMEVMRDMILSLHGVPKSLAGLDDSTYSNSSEAQRIFQMYTLKPMLSMEADVYNTQLIAKYYRTTELKLKFIPEECVESNKEEVSQYATSLYTSKIITLNEAREIAGLDSIEGGDDIAPSVTPEPMQEDQEDDQEEEKEESKTIMKNLNELKEMIKSIPDIEERINNKKDELKKYILTKQLKSESEFRPVVEQFFLSQLARQLQSLDKHNVSMKAMLNYDKENKFYYDTTIEEYKLQAENYKRLANELIGSETKAQTGSVASEKADLASQLINATTQEELEKIIADAVRNNLDINIVKDIIIDKYEDWLFGAQNLEILKKYGVYEEVIRLDNDGRVIHNGKEVYNNIAEKISKADYPNNIKLDLYTALIGMMPEGDPLIGAIKTIAQMYGYTEGMEKKQRLEDIAVSEMNGLKNSMMRAEYFTNPDVKQVEWLTAGDNYVRRDHAIVDGTAVVRGQYFVVGGEKMAYPGDSSASASQTANCRCTLIPIVNL